MAEKKRVNWNWIKKDWLFLLPSLIWIGILAVTTILWSDNRISSDWSAELILARELLREKKLITDTWHYSTEIRILYTQLLAMPLFCVFHSWDVIRAGQGCLLHLLLLLSYCFCMKGTKISPKWVYLSSVFLFIPFSYIYIDIVHMGQSYQPHMILSFLIVGLYLRLTEHRSIPAAVFLILLSFLCGLSGIRYLQILSLPMLGAAFWIYYRSKAGILWAIGSAAATAAGYVINEKFLHRWFAFGSYKGVKFAEFQDKNFIELLDNKLGDFFVLFGYRGGEKLMSASGVCNLLSILEAAVLILICIAVFRHSGKMERKKRFLIAFLGSSLLINTFVFLVLDNYYVSRYYILALFWVAPILAVFGEEVWRKNSEKDTLAETIVRKRFLGKAVLPVLLLCLCLTGIHTLSMLAQNDENSDRKKAADFLQENDVTFGYATFWNADVITELTDGEVNVVSISSCDPFTVYDWLMPERYLEKGILEESDGNQIFLLLTWEEYEEYRNSPVIQEAGEPVYTADGYMILLYDKQSFWKTYIETTDNGET